jgi:hypothetical protein
MLNWNGNLLSVTLPKETVSSKLRLKQYEIISGWQKKVWRSLSDSQRED